MKIDYTIPVKIAYDMMDSRKTYADYQKEYIRVYRKYMWLNDLEKPWAKDVIGEWYSRLEFAWKNIIDIDGQLIACSDMLGIKNRFVFIQIARIYATLYKDEPMDYVKSEDVEKLIELLEDNEYNGECLSPFEIRSYIWKREWDKIM